MDITLYLPDGFYSKTVIYSPPVGIAHLIEPLRSFCPASDDRYLGVAVQGGNYVPVIRGQNEWLASVGAPKLADSPARPAPTSGVSEARIAALESAVGSLTDAVRVLMQERGSDDAPNAAAPRTSFFGLRAEAKRLGLSAAGTREELEERIAKARGDA